MKADLNKILQTFWNTIGKKSTIELLSRETEKYIESVCLKHGMQKDAQVKIAENVSYLIQYISNAQLNKERIDKQKVIAHIKGPIAQSLMVGVASMNNSDNFIAELISKVEGTDVDNVESFFSEIGLTDTASYINTYKDVLIQIQERRLTGTSYMQIEEDIPYAEVVDDSSSIRNSHVTTNSPIHEGMSEQEEDAFIQGLPSRFTGQKLATPSDVLNTINTFVKASEDVVKFTELQKTKRAEIRAQAATRIKEIDAMRDVIMTYLEKTFDERSKIFAKQFECVDKALADGDTNLLAISLNSITDLAKSSPFKALADIGNIKKQLIANNSTFDI